MKKYFHVHFLRVYGAYVHIHWSAFAVAAVFLAYGYKVPLSAASYIISYFGMILLHEAGHAYFAKRMGYKPLDIYLSALHGSCLFHQPNSYKDECIIAWGGVIAQLIVATPLILLMLTTSLVKNDILGPIILTLGPLSAIIALTNLIPSGYLDGGKAWHLIPMLMTQYKQNKKSKKKKSHLKVVK